MKLTPPEQKVVQLVARQFPEFISILSRWRTEELERLPYAVGPNSGVMQGRAQVLAEMQELFIGRVGNP